MVSSYLSLTVYRVASAGKVKHYVVDCRAELDALVVAPSEEFTVG